MTIGKRIKERRLSLGMTVDELAAKLGKNRATVYRYESDAIKEMPLSVLVPLADALYTTPAYLIGICGMFRGMSWHHFCNFSCIFASLTCRSASPQTRIKQRKKGNPRFSVGSQFYAGGGT